MIRFTNNQLLRFLRRLEQALKDRAANKAVLDNNDESEGSESPHASSPLLAQSKQKSTNYRFSRQRKVANITWDESDRKENLADNDILSDD